MKTGLKGKSVVITGGTAGIGKAAALAFAREGAKVAVCARNENKLEAMRQIFAEISAPLLTGHVDVTQIPDVEAFAEKVVAEWGRIDVWVNNAGLSEPMPFDETDENAYNRMMNTNLKSVFFGSACAARHMKRSGGGVIIQTSSFTSIIPTAGKMLSSATKAAVNSMLQTMAGELAAYNIRVVGVSPGYIRTEMTAANIKENGAWLVSNITANRLGEPEDLADLYVFLASDAAKYMTGVAIPFDGGKLCVQNPMWSWEKKKKEEQP